MRLGHERRGSLVTARDDADAGGFEGIEQPEEGLAGHREGVADTGGAQRIGDEPTDRSLPGRWRRLGLRRLRGGLRRHRQPVRIPAAAVSVGARRPYRAPRRLRSAPRTRSLAPRSGPRSGPQSLTRQAPRTRSRPRRRLGPTLARRLELGQRLATRLERRLDLRGRRAIRLRGRLELGVRLGRDLHLGFRGRVDLGLCRGVELRLGRRLVLGSGRRLLGRAIRLEPIGRRGRAPIPAVIAVVSSSVMTLSLVSDAPEGRVVSGSSRTGAGPARPAPGVG